MRKGSTRMQSVRCFREGKRFADERASLQGTVEEMKAKKERDVPLQEA